MLKFIRLLVRGPFWVPLAAALAVLVIGLVLRQGFGLEAAPYARMAQSPTPPVVALDAYRLPAGTAPREARLRVQVMTGAQLQLRTMPRGGDAATVYFLPFTAPPGGAGEGRILGGMLLDRQARDAFVQWAVTQAHPRLASDGVELTVAGLTAPAGDSALAGIALRVLRARGLSVVGDPVLVEPYLGQRAAVLAMEAARVRSNPLPRAAYLIAVALLLFSINRYAQHRAESRPEPEPLSLAAIRDTAFERLMHALALSEPAADPATAQVLGATLAPRAAGHAGLVRKLEAAWRFAGIWLGAIGLGWVLARVFPNVMGEPAFYAGIAAGPALGGVLLLVRRAVRRRRAAAPAVAELGAQDTARHGHGRRKARCAPTSDPYEVLKRRVAAGKA